MTSNKNSVDILKTTHKKRAHIFRALIMGSLKSNGDFENFNPRLFL